MPIRIHRQRIKGWKNPLNTKYVGRGSRWGSPFVVGKDGTAVQCIEKYCNYLLPYTHHGESSGLDNFYKSEAMLEEIKCILGGKNLSCWCALDVPCHADWLLKLANETGVE